MNVKQGITPTSITLVVSHVLLESTRNKVFKPQRVPVFRVKLALILRLLVQVALIFVTHANQVGILQQHRMPMDVKNAQKATCKALKALFHVNRWVPMPLDWVVVLQKSWYHQDRI